MCLWLYFSVCTFVYKKTYLILVYFVIGFFSTFRSLDIIAICVPSIAARYFIYLLYHALHHQFCTNSSGLCTVFSAGYIINLPDKNCIISIYLGN